MRFALLIIFFLFFDVGAWSQHVGGWYSDFFTEENGLSNSLCKSIDFDQRGNVWIGTDGGVFQFDGQSFFSYRGELPSKYVKSVFSTTNGNTYISTDKGLLKLQWKNQDPSFELLYKGGNHHLGQDLWYPKQIFELSDGSVWVVDNKGLLRIDMDGAQKFELPEALHPLSFSRSFQLLEKNDSIFAMSQRGQCFVLEGDQFVLKREGPSIKNNVHEIAYAGGNYLVASDDYLKLIEHPVSGVVLDSILVDVSCLQAYKSGFLAGTWNSGLKFIKVQNQRIFVVDMEVEVNGAINEIKQHGHQFWLATDEGCGVFEPHDFISFLNVESEKGIVRQKNGQVLSVLDNQIFQFNSSLNQFQPFKKFGKEVNLLTCSPDGTALALVNNIDFVQLDEYGGIQQVRSLPKPKSITASIIDENNDIWWAEEHQNGVFRMNSNGDIKHFSKSDGISVEPIVFQIDESNGDLWIGAEGNSSFLFKYEKELETFRNFSGRLPIDHHIDVKVNDLSISDGKVYFATQLGLFTSSNQRIELVELGQYTDSDIHGFQILNDRIWFGSSEGLICKMKQGYLVFNRSNGLPSRQVSYRGIKLFDSTDLWVSTPKGVGIINVSIEPKQSPPCIIRSVTSNNSDLDLTNVAVSSDDALMIDFSNTLPGARRAQYQFRVLPNDSAWMPCTKSRGIMVANLKKGANTIELRSKLDGNFIWSESLLIPIEVSKVWYKKWWVIALSFIGMFGLAALTGVFFSGKERRENEKLNKIVQERTQELEEKNTELEKARKTAEVSNLAKSHFLSTMTHEIRTPMNAVIGMTNLLQDDNPLPNQKEKLDILSFSANNLLKIINDILDLNKIEVNKVEIEKAPINLVELIENLIKSLDPSSNARKNQLRAKMEVSNEWVLGDSTRLSQVLINLINNAIKFTSNGRITLYISEVGLSSDASTFNFKISDTGIGIPQEKLDTIFESFSQASSSTTREFGGTGLGLPISKNLVGLMGGELQVQSEVNKGSDFYFELDFLIHHLHRTEMKPIKTVAKDLSGINILLTEDNSMNVAVVTAYLDRWGATYTLAVNGQEALEKASLMRFDLILMDIHMPIMDGYESTRKIRGLEDVNKAKVPIIALTASAMVEIQREVSKAGMNGFVSKPFEPDDLYKTICSVLKNKEF